MKKSVRNLLTIILSFVMVSFSQEQENLFKSISGVLPEVVSAGDKPYLVTGDIFVSPGSVVTIEPGAVFLFEEFTGLHVQGTLYVKGKKGKPVVFTSKNDSVWNNASSVNPAPFDWNGMDIYENAIGTSLSGAVIQYSVYGIRSQTEYVRIENSVISKNGKADFTIKGKKEAAEDSVFNYKMTVEKEKKVSKPEAIPPSPENKRKAGPGIQVLRYCGLAAGIGGIGAAGWLYTKFRESKDDLSKISNLDRINMRKYTSEDWDRAKKERDRNMVFTGLAGGIGVLGLTAFGISFAF
ncbi:MAG: hypothetical protein GXY77_00490 [Fibrobacter sp.]|nr:hypothetical protein [Fibrobacter sp.]